MPGRSTLPEPSGQPSPSASRSTTNRMARTAASYIWSRNPSSPVQRQTSATALGNLALSSVLPGSALVPKYTCPSGVTSCTILPERAFTRSLTSRRARRWSLIGPNWPAATDPPDRRYRAGRRRVVPALVAGEHPQVPRGLHGVGEVLLGPLDAARQQRVAGQVHPRPRGQRGARGDLGGQRPGRVAQGLGQLVVGRLQALVGAGDREPHGP